MTRKYLTILPASLLFLAGTALPLPAQRDDRDQGRKTSESRTQMSAQNTLFGRVTEYEAGKSLKIETREGEEKSFDLSSTDKRVTVGSGVQKGTPVKVTESMQGGRRTVNIEHYPGAMASGARDDRRQAKVDEDVTYGTVKEYQQGQKLVVDIRWRPDREFNLAEMKDWNVQVAPNLKVGDRVKITEREENDRKWVTVAPAVREAADAAAGERGSRAMDADVTIGTLKTFEPGKKVVVDVRWRPDLEYELSDADVAVQVAPGLKVGDPVVAVEHEENGRRTVMIRRGGEAHWETKPSPAP
jgi:hypothetical protein